MVKIKRPLARLGPEDAIVHIEAGGKRHCSPIYLKRTLYEPLYYAPLYLSRKNLSILFFGEGKAGKVELDQPVPLALTDCLC